MTGIGWSRRYETRDAAVDFQHQRLFALVDELHAATSEGRGEAILTDVLIEFVRYTRTHFRSEEVLMRRAGFEGLDAHAREHEHLTREVESLLSSRADAGTERLCAFAYDWLVGHIHAWDMPMIEFIRGADDSSSAMRSCVSGAIDDF